MKNFKLRVGLLFLLLLAKIGTFAQTSAAREQAIKDITKSEQNFSAMAGEKGIEASFSEFAALDVIIRRGNDSLIYGRAGVANFYSKDVYKRASLSWSPDFVDASESGDLGYSIGKYHWILKDKDGKVIDDSWGIFHTVWKKQKDGQWKFVWD